MLDQNDLETVIPAVGRQVLVLNGKFRGYKAMFEKLDVENFESTLKLCDENILVFLTYDHFRKLGSADCTYNGSWQLYDCYNRIKACSFHHFFQFYNQKLNLHS